MCHAPYARLVDTAPFVALAGPLVAALAQGLRSRYGTSPARRQLHRDLALYKELPEAGGSRERLQAHIEASLEHLLSDESTKRRDPSGIGIAIFFLATAAVFTYEAVVASSWSWTWWIGALLLWLFGGVGLGISAKRAERDERGRALDRSTRTKKPKTGASSASGG